MTTAALASLRVRHALAVATRPTHEMLHADPILQKLSDPSITAAQYDMALAVFARFYDAVEAARDSLGVWPAFGLIAECAALRADLAHVDIPTTPRLHLPSDLEVLGALYVAHGAAFGRSQFRVNVAAVLPRLPHHFVGRGSNLPVWKALVAKLEAEGTRAGAMARLTVGAQRSFDYVTQTSACFAGEQVRERSDI